MTSATSPASMTYTCETTVGGVTYAVLTAYDSVRRGCLLAITRPSHAQWVAYSNLPDQTLATPDDVERILKEYNVTVPATLLAALRDDYTQNVRWGRP